MYNFFDEFYNLNSFDNLMFSRQPLSVKFNTPSTKDISPAAPWTKGENCYSTVVRVVGINPSDVEVSMEESGIVIKGESDTFNEKYSQEVSLGIAKDIMSNIKEVNYEVKNGMCKVVLCMKEPECRSIAINKVVGLDDAPVPDSGSEPKVDKESRKSFAP